MPSGNVLAGAVVAGSAVALMLLRARSRSLVPMATIEEARNSDDRPTMPPPDPPASSSGDGSACPSDPPVLTGSPSKLRSAAVRVRRMADGVRRMDGSYAVPETIFDSPLQQAMHLLQSLADRLEESADPELTAMAQRAVKLLHSTNLQQAPTIEVSDVDEMASEWLESTGSGRFRKGTPPTVLVKSNSAPTMARRSTYAKQPAVLNPRVSVVPADEAKLLQLLEHGVTSWEFDALRLDELSGGHALSMLGAPLHPLTSFSTYPHLLLYSPLPPSLLPLT